MPTSLCTVPKFAAHHYLPAFATQPGHYVSTRGVQTAPYGSTYSSYSTWMNGWATQDQARAWWWDIAVIGALCVIGVN